MNRTITTLAVAVVSLAGLGAVLGLAMPAKLAQPRLSPSHECSFCHLSHTGKTPSLLIAEDVEVLCLTCHGPGGASAVKARNHEGQTCTVCHDPHDGEFNRFGRRNIKLLKADVVPKGTTTHRPVTFESRGSDAGQPVLHSFCDRDLDGDGIYDNVCDTCHSSYGPELHLYTDPMSHDHNPGRTCTECHMHKNGFVKQ